MSGTTWKEEFKGKCITCTHAFPSPRKNEMMCRYQKAWSRGLPQRPGGTQFEVQVHKLFGSIYHKEF